MYVSVAQPRGEGRLKGAEAPPWTRKKNESKSKYEKIFGNFNQYFKYKLRQKGFYKVSREERTKLQESIVHVKIK